MPTFNGWKKFYVEDNLTDWFWGRVMDGAVSIDFLMELDKLFIEASRRGVPWKCLLARAILAASERNPSLFPYPVRYAYVDGSLCYLFATLAGRRARRSRQRPTCLCFRHNFTKQLRQFDQITKTQFIELFGEGGVEIRLRPPVRRQHNGDRDHGRPQPSRRPSEREAGERRLVGARKRADDAGLLAHVELGGPRPTI